MLQERLDYILKKIEKIENDKEFREKNRLPENTFYMDEYVLCYPRKYGVTRFPCNYDGLNLWAHSSGYINCSESNFSWFTLKEDGVEPSVLFFGGVKCKNGEFFPISLTGVSKQPNEVGVKRYTVYSANTAYYITKTDDIVFCVRAGVTKDKKVVFSILVNNSSNKEIYVASHISPLLRYSENDWFWNRLYKSSEYNNGNYIIHAIDSTNPSGKEEHHYMSVCKSIDADAEYDVQTTTARRIFKGGTDVGFVESEALWKGAFSKKIDYTTTIDDAIAGDIIMFNNKMTTARVDFVLDVAHAPKAFDDLEKPEISFLDDEIESLDEERKNKNIGLSIHFGDWKNGKINSNVLNQFIESVKKQVYFCAMGKNYAGNLLGVRDVFQQLEASLIWQPEEAREKIVRAMNFIDETGRAPREFAVPTSSEQIPQMNLAPYIDQGVWIINTIYTYLCYTDDYSILDEECGYYKFIDNKKGIVEHSNRRDSVLTHLLQIVEFLSSNIDREYETNCLRVLHGDWNDAVDGLGRTKDTDREYGSGVTVMATAQFYHNLKQMSEMLGHIGGYDDKIKEFEKLRSEIEQGLFKYAIDKDENGNTKIIHGWGDKLLYKIGSFCDTDGADRDSLTSNAFWVIEGLCEKDESLKNIILSKFKRLDSKYGLKTFEPYFPADMEGVGRIRTLTKGTAENACAYIHASLFAIMALFMMGESEMAWEQIEKSICITHKSLSKTPFVMPNSYCHNEELGIDGESMNDWYTGSGAVLLKELVRLGFGIEPAINGLRIKTAKTFPTNDAKIQLRVKNCDIILKYSKSFGIRKYLVNGEELTPELNKFSNTYELFIPVEKLTGNMTIEVFD